MFIVFYIFRIKIQDRFPDIMSQGGLENCSSLKEIN